MAAGSSSSNSTPSGTGSEHSPPTQGPSSQSKIAVDNQQLYEHYIKAVAPILTGESEKEGLYHWDSAIRRFSHSNDYLYSVVLAFSGLHLATESSDPVERKGYLDAALQHQNAALEKFRPVLSSINAENCEPALTCAGLIVACSLAVPLVSPSTSTGSSSSSQMQQLKRIMAMFDGIVTLYRMGWTTMLDPNISPFIRQRVVQLWSQEKPAPEAEASLDNLAQNAVLSLEDLDKRDLYLMTIEKMKRTHRRLVEAPDKMIVVLFWPGMVPGKYFRALEAQEPIALVILAHWAVCLHQCRHFFWVGNWGVWIVATVTEALGDKWRSFLDWPYTQVA